MAVPGACSSQHKGHNRDTALGASVRFLVQQPRSGCSAQPKGLQSKQSRTAQRPGPDVGQHAEGSQHWEALSLAQAGALPLRAGP